MKIYEARKYLSKVSCLNFTFVLHQQPECMWLQVQFPAACRDTGKEELQHGRKWRVSYHATKSELIQTAFKAALTVQEHELREFFLYRGSAIFGPHFDVDRLHELASTAAPDGRTPQEMDGEMWIHPSTEQIRAWPFWETKEGYVWKSDALIGRTEIVTYKMVRPWYLFGMNKRGEIVAADMRQVFFTRIKEWQYRKGVSEWLRVPDDLCHIGCVGGGEIWRPAAFAMLDGESE